MMNSHEEPFHITTEKLLALTILVLRMESAVRMSQYHGYWWPGSYPCKIISCHGIDYPRKISPYLPCGRISTHGVILQFRCPLNDFIYISHWATWVNSQNRPHFEGDYRNWWLKHPELMQFNWRLVKEHDKMLMKNWNMMPLNLMSFFFRLGSSSWKMSAWVFPWGCLLFR